MQDTTRLQVASISQAGADGRVDAAIQARKEAQDAGLDMKAWQTEVSAQLKREGFDDAFLTRIFAAQAGSAPADKAPPAPQRGARRPLPAPPGRGGGADRPPVAGARKAPDGQWYVPDPKRPGKYSRVVTSAGAGAG